MVITILVLGFLVGIVLQYAKLNRYDTVSGLATLDNFAIAKAIFIGIGVGAILLNIEIGFGFATYHIKPFMIIGIVLGGLIFGSGMAILGYCPGTLAVSLGEGSLDALLGIVGGLIGGFIYTLLVPSFNFIIGPNLGNVSLSSLIGTNKLILFLLVFVFGGLFITAAFMLHKKEKTNDMKWLFAGIALAVLNAIAFLTVVTNRPIGASTAYPYISDALTGITNNNYFQKIKTPGSWEFIFLTGAFIAGLLMSLIKKEFKFKLIHDNWKKYKGVSNLKRILWSLAGGFILIFGARLADGCTSGHILSGGMQIAFSSLVFAIFVFAGLLITGRIFYKR
ncbi:MAG TPA: YeeE/YedE thiosulfate transporter family protein [Ignavibacteriaceae bacterium]|nr:YeeE/YedE thiosulfate transporter family protein [Ignavibacteriaceae bacterium]